MLRIAVFAAVVVGALSFMAEEPTFDTFRIEYSKVYSSEEVEMRRAIYNHNLELIMAHNIEYNEGLHTFTMGVNQYTDWTSAEFAQFMNGFRANKFSPQASVTHMDSSTVSSLVLVIQLDYSSYHMDNNLLGLPNSVDWRTKGYVTKVKNQKQCGSCWAFSATGSLEGQHFKKAGKLVSLSEQNLVDCSGPEGNDGCGGGLMDQAFQYIKINKGIDTEKSYPYEAKDGKCRFKKDKVGATDTGFVDVATMDEMALQNAVATVGPISVAIDASRPSFQMYNSGIYSDPECSQTDLDHGVLAVGYSSQNGQDYWIVKNSWGTDWGMEGYIWMARNMNNMCGIATNASYPTV